MRSRLNKIKFDSIEKILIIKLRAIGDVLLSTVVTKNLRNVFPEAKIDFLIEKPARDILVGNPFIDEILIYEKDMGMVEFLSFLRRRRYDLVFDLFCNPRSALMTYFTRARYRIGYKFRGRGYAYNIKLKPRSEICHNVEFNLDALRAIGIKIIDRNIYMPISSDDEKFALEFWGRNNLDGKLVIALNPGGTWETKRWGIEKFAQLGDMLNDKLGAKIILIWGIKDELEDVRRMSRMMNCEPVIIPPTSLKQLASILRLCSLTVSNDSGPMHISAAVGTPTLGIYGPTNPYAQGPYGEKNLWIRMEELECIACNLTKCSIGNICMKNLNVDAVFNAVLRLMEKNRIKF